MAKKDKTIVMPGDIGNSFDKSDYILNYRPDIKFIEPEQETQETIKEEPPTTTDSLRTDTQKTIEGLGAIAQLIDQAQNRIDQRVNSSGGLDIKLDPKKDALTIAAMKRRFPDKKDPNVITYDDYKQALDCLSKNTTPLSINDDDIRKAGADPLKTDFGGSDNKHGENRPEISSSAASVEPLDLDVFQKGAIIALFALLLPLILIEINKAVTTHFITAPHKPI